MRSVNLDEDDNDHVDRSQFFTNSSITSINISDYLNKQLTCDSDGNIIVLNNPKSWNQKDELFSVNIFLVIYWVKKVFLVFLFRLKQLVKFITVVDKNESSKDSFRPNPIIVDFNRFRNSVSIKLWLCEICWIKIILGINMFFKINYKISSF